MNMYDVRSNQPNPLGATIVSHGKVELTEEEKKKQAYFDSKQKSIPAEMTVSQEKAIPDHTGVGTGQDEIRETVNILQKLLEGKADELKNKYNSLIARMRSLQDEIYALESEPYTKKDLLNMAKKALREEQKKQKIEFLTRHLLDCQAHKCEPFSETGIFSAFDREQYWIMAYYIFDEKDIEEAMKNLPDTGISLKEREEKIKVLTDEIGKIREDIHQEYENIKGTEL